MNGVPLNQPVSPMWLAPADLGCLIFTGGYKNGSYDALENDINSALVDMQDAGGHVVNIQQSVDQSDGEDYGRLIITIWFVHEEEE